MILSKRESVTKKKGRVTVNLRVYTIFITKVIEKKEVNEKQEQIGHRAL
jgi:hypothetical protein